MDIKHPEWQASHDPTKYPFSDDAPLQNDEGDAILEGTFLDAALYPIGGQADMYLSKVVVESDSVTIYIGDELESERAYTEFSPAEPPDELRLVDSYDRPAGILVSEAIRLSTFLSWSSGTHTFQPYQTPFVATVCVPTPSTGLLGIQLPNGEVVQGDVWLVGDDGVVLSCDTNTLPAVCEEPAITENVIRVDVVGDPLFRRRLCADPGEFPTPRFLETITFCTPPLLGTDVVIGSSVLADTDILFLVDTTSSMSGFIDDFRTIFSPLAQLITNQYPTVDFHWAVADYRDFDTYAWKLGQAFTDKHHLAQAAVDSWTTSGGGDIPEAQFNAMSEISEQWETTLGGRSQADAKRIVVWAGDAPGKQSSDDPLYRNLSDAASALALANIQLLALNIQAAASGIDAVWPTGVGEPNQASTLVSIVGGDIRHSVGVGDAAAVQQMIVDALTTIVEDNSGGVPGSPQVCYTCGPGTHGDIKMTVGSALAPDAAMRIRSVSEGMVIEMAGETLEGIDRRR